MRKFFLFFLILISFWIWSLDGIDILFFYSHYSYTSLTGNILALIPFLLLVYYFTPIFLNYFSEASILTKEEQLKEFGVLLLCFLPILFLNYQRIIFPDADYDVQSYHLYLHTLNRFDNCKNFNLIGDSGGGTYYFFSLSYKIFGFARQLLGYRLGAIFNTFLLFLTYVSVYDFLTKFLRSFFPEKKVLIFLIALSAMFTIFADNTLFNLNSYKIDLIGVPLLLELLHIAFFKRLNNNNKIGITIYFFVVASLIIAYKLTYLPYAAIIGLYLLISNHQIYLADKKLIGICFLTLLFPSIYLLYNYTATLNPVFPFYNKLFKSPLYYIQNFKDERWGPRNWKEFFTYNIITLLHKERNSEFAFFSVRLLAEYLIIIVSAITLFYNKFKIKNACISFILYLSLIAILCNYALLYTTGYYRYGIFIEVIFGVILILWLYYLFFNKKWIPFGILCILLLIQSINTFNRIFKWGENLSWYQYKDLRNNPTLLKAECGLLLNDYKSGIDSSAATLHIDAFLSSDLNGLIKLFSPNTPIYNLPASGPVQKLVDSFEKNKIDTLSQLHNFYALATMYTLQDKINDLNNRNYYVDSIVDFYPTFLLTNTPLYLLKIKHYNKERYKIVNTVNILRIDSAGISPHFFYKMPHEFKSYIIEDPFIYNDQNREDCCKFIANNILYNMVTADNKNKIVTVQNNSSLSFINYNELHYIIITQELKSCDTTKSK
jgi:hypothetical protein